MPEKTALERQRQSNSLQSPENEESDHPISVDISHELIKLEPSLTEQHFENLLNESAVELKDISLQLHKAIDRIMKKLELVRMVSHRKHLKLCREQIQNIQALEKEQDIMLYQIRQYTAKVREAHKAIFDSKLN